MGTNGLKKGMNIHARRAIAYIVLIFLTILCLIWFYILVINATRSRGELTAGFTPFPSTHLFENLHNVFTGSLPILNGLLNSAIVAGSCAVLSTYFSAMTAYAVHAYDFKGKKAVTTFILAIMTIPTQVAALGFVQLVSRMNLLENLLPLIIPSIAAPAVFFYMRQYMQSALPMALIEAARIDGAGEFRIFNTMVIPLMKPAIAVQAIFTFVANWNNYFTPQLIITENEKMKTLPLLLAELRSADFLKFDMGQVYAMILLCIVPVIVVYLILSKHIVGGVALGGVKG